KTTTERRRRSVWRAPALTVLATLAVVLPATASSATARADAKQTPTILLTVGRPMIAPGTAKATAKISGLPSLSGYLTVSLYAPSTQLCSGDAFTVNRMPIIVGTGTATKTLERLIRAKDPSGLWHWKASYEGDATHNSAESPCIEQLIIQSSPDVPPAWAPFSSAADLVTRQYRDFLGRAPSESELNTWVLKLTNRTATAGNLVETLRLDPDQIKNVDPAVRLYRAYFLRNPEAAGLRYWIAERRKGRTLGSISEFFANSSEFKNRYGSLTNAAFVGLVYENVLERAGEPGGVMFWTEQLNRGVRNRGTVMIGFSESPEYVRTQASEVTVAVLYALMLGRAPTPTEFTGTVAILDLGPDTPLPFTAGTLALDIISRGAYLSSI
ncbi:MAG: DUF4214 domain-containing protein, partial [Aquihabitans sp.]